MKHQADVFYLDTTGLELEGADFLGRLGVAQEFQPAVYRHFATHGDGCRAVLLAGGACDCGLIAVFGSDRAMVIVDCEHAAEVHALN